MKTYFITGISGFLGRNITLKLLEQNDVKIIGFVLPHEKNLEFFNKNQNVTLVLGDILNISDVKRFLSMRHEGEKIIIHAAGMITTFKRNDKLAMTVNYQGTKNVVDSAVKYGCDKFIYVSSVDSLDKRKGEEPIFEQDNYDVNKVDGVYSKSKVLANNYVLENVRNSNLPGLIVLPSAIIGPNDPFNSPINYAVKKFLKGKLNVLVKGQYNLVDVRDVAQGIVDASNKGKIGESYILSGTHISMLDFINSVAYIEHKKPITKLIPIPLVKIASPFIETHARIHKKRPLFTGFSMDCLQQNSYYQFSKANQEFGYKSRELNATIKDLVSWMKESGYLDK